MTRLHLAVCALLFVGWAAPVPGAEPADSSSGSDSNNNATELDSVEVSADHENLADPTKAATTGAVRVIEREEFANRITTLADTLAGETGIQIRQAGGLGSISAISIRGSSSRQVQVYLDGMLLNDPVNGDADLSLYSLHDIGQIKVYPNSPPSRFAEAGVGGVVSMTSQIAEPGGDLRVRLGAGSFGSRKAGLFYGGGFEDLSYWVSLNRQSADNDFSYANRSQWFNPNDGDITTRRNADVEQNDISGKLGYRLENNRRVDALVQWIDRDQGVPTIQNFRNNDAQLETDNTRLQLHYEDLGLLGGRLHQNHRLLWSSIDDSYRDLSGQVGTGRLSQRTETQQLALNSSLSWLLGNHVFSGTTNIARYWQEQRDRLQDTGERDRKRFQINTALSHEWSGLDQRLQSEAVVRHIALFEDGTAANPDNSVSDSDADDQFFAWNLGAAYQLFSPVRIYGNIARQIRIPTLLERFGQRGLFVGNGQLEAEKALSAELGTRLTHGPVSLEVTGYLRDLDPAIVATYDARGVGRYVNIAALVTGVEIEARTQLFDFWELSVNGTLQDSEIDSPNIADRDGKQLPGVYHRSGRITSAWTYQPFRFALDYRYDDELFYDGANILPADERKTLDARLTWHHAWSAERSTRLDLEIRNLTDALYQDFNRFPSAGRSYFATLEQSF